MISLTSALIIGAPFIGLGLVFIYAAFFSPPEGPDFGQSVLNRTNTTKPVQTYNFQKVNKTEPSISELIRRNATIGDLIKSNAGFLYSSLAAEEVRPEPWSSRESR